MKYYKINFVFTKSLLLIIIVHEYV